MIMLGVLFETQTRIELVQKRKILYTNNAHSDSLIVIFRFEFFSKQYWEV